MGELLKRVLLVKLVEETRWRAKIQVATSSNTSYVAGGNILKHFLCCRWQPPYIWGHDPPRKWD